MTVRSVTFIISVMKGVGSVNIYKRLTTHDRVLLQRYPSTTIDTECERSDVGCENILVMKIDTTCTTNYESENSIAHTWTTSPKLIFCSQNNLSGGLSGSKCVEQASNAGHRWCLFQSLEDSLIGTQFCFSVHPAAIKV